MRELNTTETSEVTGGERGDSGEAVYKAAKAVGRFIYRTIADSNPYNGYPSAGGKG